MNLLVTRNAKGNGLEVNIIESDSMDEGERFCEKSNNVFIGIVSSDSDHYAQKGLAVLADLCDISDTGLDGDCIRAALEHILTRTAEFCFKKGQENQKALDDLQ